MKELENKLEREIKGLESRLTLKLYSGVGLVLAGIFTLAKLGLLSVS